MTGDRERLEAFWPLVRVRLPAPPARVVDVGCGPAGGFVPFLRSAGYEAVGVDPQAPDGSEYRRTELEQLERPGPFDAAVASTSLHHVRDPAVAVDRLAAALAPGGVLVVVEWAWEDFDEATAHWCFERLGDEPVDGWLRGHRDTWEAGAPGWEGRLREWAAGHGLHRADELVRLLDERFERVVLERGPYLFVDLPGTSEADERAAIDAGEIRPTRVDWVGTLPA